MAGCCQASLARARTDAVVRHTVGAHVYVPITSVARRVATWLATTAYEPIHICTTRADLRVCVTLITVYLRAELADCESGRTDQPIPIITGLTIECICAREAIVGTIRASEHGNL